MTANNDPIANKLGLVPVETVLDQNNKCSVTTIIDNATDDSINRDFNYARSNIIKLIEDGNDAIYKLSQIAEQSQQARAYEVLGGIFATMLKANQDLMDLQKKNIEINKKAGNEVNSGPKNVTNNLFVGSTNDLYAALEAMNKDK